LVAFDFSIVFTTFVSVLDNSRMSFCALLISLLGLQPQHTLPDVTSSSHSHTSSRALF
jgi:hypothetical protein